MKKNILLVSNTSWYLFNFRKNTILKLIDLGYEVSILAPLDSYSNRLIDLGCNYHPLKIDNKGVNPFKDTLLFLKLLLNLLKIKPDVICCFTIKPNIYCSIAAAILGKPTINNVSGLGTAFINANWLTILVKKLYKIAFLKSKVVYFQNPDDQSIFVEENIVNKTRAILLPGSGVDINHFSPSTYKKSDSSTTFLLIARLLKDKGVVEYVNAAKKTLERDSTAKFQLLGPVTRLNSSAITQKELDSWIEEGVIEYLGVTDNVKKYIDKCDCVVLPSYREGTPRTLLEAGAMGKPLIATNVPGCKEIVIDKYNGYLCKVKSADDLHKKMFDFIKLDSSEKLRMGNNSRDYIVQHYNEDIVIKSYLTSIESTTSPLT